MIEDTIPAPNQEGEPMAKKAAPKKRAKRARKASAPKKAARRAIARKSSKRGPGKRYTAAEKAKIMAAAKKLGLTGAQAAKRFGISMLTFYRWRGPVRGKRAGKRGPGRPAGVRRVKVDIAAVRREVQAQVRALLPRIIREEVAAALGRTK